MSFWSGLGKVLKTAAPFASLIPGVGIPLGIGLGAAGGALGSALDHTNVLQGAAGGGLGAGAIGAGKGVAGGGGVGGTLGKIGQYAPYALAGLSAIQGSQQQGKANKINDQLLAQLNQQAAGQAQARSMALARLGQAPPTAPNLSRLTASSNPFARAA